MGHVFGDIQTLFKFLHRRSPSSEVDGTASSD